MAEAPDMARVGAHLDHVVRSSSAPAASPRIRTMIERRGEFADQLEFEIEASKDHWSELEPTVAANPGEVGKPHHFQVLGGFRRHLGWMLLWCKCARCSSELGRSQHPGSEAGEQFPSSILGRFRRRLGSLFLCWQCGMLRCAIFSSNAHEQNQMECVELEEAEESEGEGTNREVFESIKKQWGGFFSAKWGDNLELGRKIAEGGQAEIFAVEGGMGAVRMELVVKAFKKGYSLRSLELQWLQFPNFHCTLAKSAIVFAGTILKDDRFALVMHKYWGDLRKLIDLRMQERNGNGPPFSERQAVSTLLQIATGMDHLHKKLRIAHRDLKASNILVATVDPRHDGTEFSCVVADYECSVGVVGTGFWRAPEVLVAVRDQSVTPATFSPQADVYSFAMTSYEILTGCVPFEELGPDDYDDVVRGLRPQLPHPMNSRVTELLCRCWHTNPAERPSFEEIGIVLETVMRSYPPAGDSSNSSSDTSSS